jgi:flagellar basal-body rod modification protein FlgD
MPVSIQIQNFSRKETRQMASVSNSLFSNPTSSSGASANSNAASNNAADATSSLANQSTFLQLLVAQLKNQDPSQPVDGTTFVTQLAQFSDLEQNLASRQDLDSISQQYTGSSSATTSTSSTPSS